VDGDPSRRYINDGRPKCILTLIIHQYNKRALLVIKWISHIISLSMQVFAIMLIVSSIGLYFIGGLLWREPTTVYACSTEARRPAIVTIPLNNRSYAGRRRELNLRERAPVYGLRIDLFYESSLDEPSLVLSDAGYVDDNHIAEAL
jgi:hypothetical protein